MLEVNNMTQIYPVMPVDIYNAAMEVSLQFGYLMLFVGIIVGSMITYGIMKNWPLIKEKING
jgi:vacuolar-type H+-ATPase subunit I/STV1